MTGVDGTAGLDQIAQPPHAHCSVDLNEGGQTPEEKNTDGWSTGGEQRQTEDMVQAGGAEVEDMALQKIRSCTMQNKW